MHSTISIGLSAYEHFMLPTDPFRKARLKKTPPIRAENILVITFTRKASDEMKERIKHILPPGGLAVF